MLGGEANGIPFEISALTDGRIEVKAPNVSFVSQPVSIESDRPTWALLCITLTATSASLEISEHVLLSDAPNVPTLLLGSAQGLVPQEFSIDDPNSTAACQRWIQNRKSKFSTPRTPRTGDRRAKTLNEQANDLVASIVRLKWLREQTLAGNPHFLGTLAGEMRASVYWPKGRETQPDHNWNPLLLRMASVADLPLPVYSVIRKAEPSIINEAILHMTPSTAPRIERMFATDQICDLQESLLTSVLRLGPSPGRVISALELVKELAHTMGAAHYDQDASSFLDVMHGMKSTEGDQATILICQVADTLVLLSEWVLSELKKRNLIG